MADFEKAMKDGVEQYKMELNEKMEILEFLIKNYNDGRRKNFYCLAVNLLKLQDIKEIMAEINEKISKLEIPLKEKIEQIKLLFEAKAKQENIELKLRK